MQGLGEERRSCGLYHHWKLRFSFASSTILDNQLCLYCQSHKLQCHLFNRANIHSISSVCIHNLTCGIGVYSYMVTARCVAGTSTNRTNCPPWIPFPHMDSGYQICERGTSLPLPVPDSCQDLDTDIFSSQFCSKAFSSSHRKSTNSFSENNAGRQPSTHCSPNGTWPVFWSVADASRDQPCSDYGKGWL